jgi:hypothetical protein
MGLHAQETDNGVHFRGIGSSFIVQGCLSSENASTFVVMTIIATQLVSQGMGYNWVVMTIIAPQLVSQGMGYNWVQGHQNICALCPASLMFAPGVLSQSGYSVITYQIDHTNIKKTTHGDLCTLILMIYTRP